MKMLPFVAALLIMASMHVAANDTCKMQLVETMPENMDYTNPLSSFKLQSTHSALMDLINGSKANLKIASFYFSLTADDEFQSAASTKLGEILLNAIERAAKRGVKVEIVIDGTGGVQSRLADIDRLKSIADLRVLNMTSILGSGVMHTKILISDNKHFYMGSSNFDWRSYTHIKEIGIRYDNCVVLANDLDKIFRTYQLVAKDNSVPEVFPDDLKTSINMETKLKLAVLGSEASVFIGAAPAAFNNNSHDLTGRTDDIEGLLKVIESAKKFIYISVMDYSPQTKYLAQPEFLPWIDNALRAAVSERNIQVKLLFSNWFNPNQLAWYRSLNAVKFPSKNSGIQVKKFVVPKTNDFEKKIPFARVKHDKYMVTDNSVYIGTSNWTPDYFTNTCGASFVASFNNNSSTTPTLLKQTKAIFERDFDSIFASDFY